MVTTLFLSYSIDFADFVQYYEKYWIRSVGVEQFCVGDLKFRTNNHIESANGKLGRLMRKHPTMYHFLKGMLDFTEFSYSELKSGYVAPGKSEISDNLKKSIQLLLNGELDIKSFLNCSFSANKLT